MLINKETVEEAVQKINEESGIREENYELKLKEIGKQFLDFELLSPNNTHITVSLQSWCSALEKGDLARNLAENLGAAIDLLNPSDYIDIKTLVDTINNIANNDLDSDNYLAAVQDTPEALTRVAWRLEFWAQNENYYTSRILVKMPKDPSQLVNYVLANMFVKYIIEHHDLFIAGDSDDRINVDPKKAIKQPGIISHFLNWLTWDQKMSFANDLHVDEKQLQKQIDQLLD